MGFGFSLISAAEVLYYMFIRWVIYLYRERKEKKFDNVKQFPIDLDSGAGQRSVSTVNNDHNRLEAWTEDIATNNVNAKHQICLVE